MLSMLLALRSLAHLIVCHLRPPILRGHHRGSAGSPHGSARPIHLVHLPTTAQNHRCWILLAPGRWLLSKWDDRCCTIVGPDYVLLLTKAERCTIVNLLLTLSAISHACVPWRISSVGLGCHSLLAPHAQGGFRRSRRRLRRNQAIQTDINTTLPHNRILVAEYPGLCRPRPCRGVLDVEQLAGLCRSRPCGGRQGGWEVKIVVERQRWRYSGGTATPRTGSAGCGFSCDTGRREGSRWVLSDHMAVVGCGVAYDLTEEF
mmetsp:Transcript_8445/g.18547  ORF Transcript_8445/g.18547 Transcript_8445/m.18547 type:complete len:260 (-) Transcript_8445:761-1540(-)